MSDNEKEVSSTETGLSYFSLGIQALMAFVMSLGTLFPYRNGFFKTVFSSWFFYPFLSVFAISLFMVYLVEWVSIKLDQKYRWEEQFLKRILFQLLFGWATPVICSVLYTWGYLLFLGINILDTLYSRYKFPSMAILILLLDVVYMCRYFDWHFGIGRKQTQQSTLDQQYAEHLTLPHKGGQIKIQVNDIAYIFSHGKHTAIQFHEGDPIILGNVSLGKILPKLNPHHFLKVNRSYIITRSAYNGYTNRSIRGICLLLKPKVNEDVEISRTKTNRVLGWIDKELLKRKPNSR